MKYTTTDELEHFSFAEAYIADVQVTGGFLKRTDAFMFSIWFFTLYAMLNSMVFYSGNLAAKVIRDCGGYLEGKKRMLPYLILLLLDAEQAWPLSQYHNQHDSQYGVGYNTSECV